MLTEINLDAILSQAKSAISNSRCLFRLDSERITEEFAGLKLDDVAEVWPLLLELLTEIQPNNYCSLSPSKEIEGQFRFIWKSHKMRKRMLITFVLRRGIFSYYSLRSERDQKSERNSSK